MSLKMKSYLQELTIAQPGGPNRDGPIVSDPPLNEEPFPLPAGFEWDILDLTNDKEVHELYVLLRDNYVEDENSTVRFDYSPEFLKWSLTPPGQRPELSVSLRHNGELVGYMNTTPKSIRIDDKILTMGVGDFLCIHKRYRGHRFTPLMMMEQIRRSHLAGIYQAVATCASKFLCQEIQSYRYYQRPLNVQKLVENDFWFLDAGESMTDLEKTISTPENLNGLRLMEKKDVPQTLNLLNKYLKETRLAPNFSPETFAHQFLPRENVVYSYVVEQNDEITDFVSVYVIPTIVIGSGVILNLGYLYYSASARLTTIIEHILPVLKEAKIDCLNVLDFDQHDEFIKKLNFRLGTGTLHYYLYNWSFSKKFSKSDISLTLL